jgi:hypothetical protein
MFVRCGFILWMAECIRELASLTVYGPVIRGREKLNYVIKIILIVCTFPMKTYIIKQEYLILLSKLVLLSFVFVSYFNFYFYFKNLFQKYVLKHDLFIVLNFDEKIKNL